MPWSRYGWNTDGGVHPILPRDGRWMGFHMQPDQVERRCHRMRKRLSCILVPMLAVDMMLGNAEAVVLITVGAGLAIQLGIAFVGDPGQSRLLQYIFIMSGCVRVFIVAVTWTDPLVILLSLPIDIGFQACSFAQVSLASLAFMHFPRLGFFALVWMRKSLFPAIMTCSTGMLCVLMSIMAPVILHSLLWRGGTTARALSSVLPVVADGGAACAGEAAAAAAEGDAWVWLRDKVQAARERERAERAAERAVTKQDLITLEMFCRHLWAEPGPERLCPDAVTKVAKFLGPECLQFLERLREVRGGQKQNDCLSECSDRSLIEACRRLSGFLATFTRGPPRPATPIIFWADWPRGEASYKGRCM